VNRRNFEKEYKEYCEIIDELPKFAKKDDCEKEFCLSPLKNPRDNVLKYPENQDEVYKIRLKQRR